MDRTSFAAQLEHITSPPQMKNGCCQRTPVRFEGIKKREPDTPCSNDPEVERQWEASVARHELCRIAGAELNAVNEPTSQDGVGHGYWRIGLVRTAEPSDTTNNTPIVHKYVWEEAQANPSTDDQTLHMAALMDDTARVPPLSRNHTPNILGSPISQLPPSPMIPMILNPRMPSLDRIRDRLGVGSGFAGRNTTDVSAEDRSAARRRMLEAIGPRVGQGRGDYVDQTECVADTVYFDRTTSLSEGRPRTLGSGMGPATPSNELELAILGGVDYFILGGRDGIWAPDWGTGSVLGAPAQGRSGRKYARRPRKRKLDTPEEPRHTSVSPQLPPTNGANPREPYHTTRQTPQVQPPVMPLTDHARGGVSPTPTSAALAVDPCLFDDRSYRVPDIERLGAVREYTSWETGQLAQGKSTEHLERHPAAVVNVHPFVKYASDITSHINLDSLDICPYAKGAFGDVRRAYMHDGGRIAIKFLRSYTLAQDAGKKQLEKKLRKEIRVWSCLKHENVLPLLGLCEVDNELGMVSEFMSNGNIQEYLRCNPKVDRYWLTINVCAGLAYLHEHPKQVIHGDLKAVNVVVDSNGIPKLMDFGLAQMILAENSTEPSSSSSLAGGTSRWMAYELISSTGSNGAHCKPTCASDVYSLGMTIYEIFSGSLPFTSCKLDAQVIYAIIQHRLPERVPNVFTEGLWELLLHCWRIVPCERPTARDVQGALQVLRQVHGDFAACARTAVAPLAIEF